MKLFLVRHGLTEWNAAKRLQGHEDIELSVTGRCQAKALRSIIDDLDYQSVVASDLKRVRETTELIGVTDYVLDPNLRERNAGSWTGRAIADIKAESSANWDGWNDGSFAPDHAEPWEEFSVRATTAIRRHIDAANGSLLVVCHGGVIRAAVTSLLGMPPNSVTPVAQASFTVLEISKNGRAKLEVYNSRPGKLALATPE